MSEEWVSGKVVLEIQGEPIEMEMTIPATPVKPRRMLPIFQAMANSFTDIGVTAMNLRGEEISCQKGCGACCRQAIPLAEIEVHHIRELVDNMPEPRRTEIRRRFFAACDVFQENKWFERLSKYADYTVKEREELINEYFYKQIPCPFLEDEACSIHADRPLICREYIVTSPAENCSQPTKETVSRVKLPAQVSTAANNFALPFAKSLDFIPLIMALHWAEKFPENTAEKPGEEWLHEFFQLLTEKDKELIPPPKEAL